MLMYYNITHTDTVFHYCAPHCCPDYHHRSFVLVLNDNVMKAVFAAAVDAAHDYSDSSTLIQFYYCTNTTPKTLSLTGFDHGSYALDSYCWNMKTHHRAYYGHTSLTGSNVVAPSLVH